ncbi:hypothetical protein TrLO_g13644 [Triparma laevis f. longispina]|uniref:WDR59/RTC1-like RING zinc finger domain-containing protein n=1 Tax=Triparma laevis f. longispina TaxID=1714387 RepID=A0A9W7A1F2_9STRA|nr:hypothetical protein TrLO_g13644 [Triparma laevis f. longispina]
MITIPQPTPSFHPVSITSTSDHPSSPIITTSANGSIGILTPQPPPQPNQPTVHPFKYSHISPPTSSNTHPAKIVSLSPTVFLTTVYSSCLTTVYKLPPPPSPSPFHKVGTILHLDGLLKPLTPVSFIILTAANGATPMIYVYDIRCHSGGGPQGVRQFPSNRILSLSRQQNGNRSKWKVLGVDSKGTIYDVDCKNGKVAFCGSVDLEEGDVAQQIKQVEGFTCVLTSRGVCYRCEPSYGSKLSHSKWTLLSRHILTIQTVPSKSYVIALKERGGVVWDSLGLVVERWKGGGEGVDLCNKETTKGCQVYTLSDKGAIHVTSVPPSAQTLTIPNVSEYQSLLKPNFKVGTPGFGSVNLVDPVSNLPDIDFQLDASMHEKPNPTQPTDLTFPPTTNPGFKSPVTVETTTTTGVEDLQAAAIMTPEVSKRTPCPRLCGATFHHGLNGGGPAKGYGMEVGGLVRFNNGGIGKVWRWYQEVKTKEEEGGEEFDDGLNNEFSRKDEDFDGDEQPPENNNAEANNNNTSNNNLGNTSTPRTFNDLSECLEKYRGMEWEGKVGGADDEDDSDDDASSSSTDDDDGMYASYFKPTTATRTTSVTSDSRKNTSDINLQDEVKVTVEIVNDYDEVISGGMSGDIAEELELPSLIKVPEPEEVASICENNARVYRSFQAEEKAAVWDLLSILLTPTPSDDVDDVDVYGDIVSRIMSYYKSVGDVQILSAVLCLLRSVSKEPQEKFNGEHDRLLRAYAEILGSWGKIRNRTAICKRITPKAQEEPLGLDIGFLCSRCGNVANDKNVCSSCRDFAFRCGVCNNRVKGAFISCFGCGHGGCAEHYRAWFKEGNEECPVGCGCKCKEACWVTGGGGGAEVEVMKKVESALSFGSVNSWTANEAHGAGLGSFATGRMSNEVDPSASSLVILGPSFSGVSSSDEYDGGTPSSVSFTPGATPNDNTPSENGNERKIDLRSIAQSMQTAEGGFVGIHATSPLHHSHEFFLVDIPALSERRDFVVVLLIYKSVDKAIATTALFFFAPND